MCMIYFKPAGVRFPRMETFEKVARRNPHGFGLVTDSRVFHTTDIELFLDQVGQLSETESVLMHFRLATNGSIKRKNCHPFKSKAANVWFAHNGIIPIRTVGDKTDSETFLNKVIDPAILKGWSPQTDRFLGRDLAGVSRLVLWDRKHAPAFYGEWFQTKTGYWSKPVSGARSLGGSFWWC